MSARRMAMGGVSLGSVTENVAYRAVPSLPGRSSGFTLPIGLAALASDPPALDPEDPDFNVFELVNLLQNPPWNLPLVKPDVPSNDVTVSLGKSYLQVDLGDVKNYLPDDDSRIAAIGSVPALGFGIGPFFTGLSGVVHYENTINFNDALRGALVDGQPFQPNTEYAVYDHAMGQVAAQLQLGLALPLVSAASAGKSALYGGARANVLRGLAYFDGDNTGSFTTQNDLFASSPVSIDYRGVTRDAAPDGGGWGGGLDLGAVAVVNGFQIGLGVNHIATQVQWTGRDRIAYRDSTTGDYVNQTVAEDVSFTSTIPVTATLNVGKAFGAWYVAADAVQGLETTQWHAGLERWISAFALRAGARIDEQSQLQYSGGCGIRAGWFGLDAAVATNSRNLTHERGVDLGVGFSLYH